MAFPSYGIMATIGLCMAVLFLYNRLEMIELTFRQFLLIVGGGLLGLLIGSRVLFVIGIIPTIKNITVSVLLHYLIYGGIVFYGGLLGLLAGICIVAKIIKKAPVDILNFIAPSIPLFHGFARIGCLLSGCCYGVQWNWGVRMVNSPEIVRFPVQLFESCCDFLIFTWLILYQKKSKHPQDILMKYLCSYAICRFILEFFRGDAVRGLWLFGISTSQVISIIIVAIIVLAKIRRKKVNEYETRSAGN